MTTYRWAYGLVSVGGVLVVVGTLLLWEQVRPAWLGSASLGVGALLAAGYFGLRNRLIYTEARRWSTPALLHLVAAVAGALMGFATLWLSALDIVTSVSHANPPTAGPIPALAVGFGVLAVLAVVSDPD